MKVKCITGIRIDGMGGRLCSLLNTIRIADKLGCHATFTWVPHHAAANISDPKFIFDVNKMKESGVFFDTLTDFLHSRSLSKNGGELAYFDNYKPFITLDAMNCDRIVVSSSHISRLEGESLDNVKSEMKVSADRHLYFSSFINEQVNKYLLDHSFSNTIGVHVRRGDIVGNSNPVHAARLISLDTYFQIIDRFLRDYGIFLCTECPDVIDQFKSRYGDRLMIPETSDWNRNSPEATRDAVVEQILLSNCRVILGSNSAFSRLSSIINNVPFVELAQDTSLNKVEILMRKLGIV